MHIHIDTAINEADAIATDVDGGVGAAILRIYDDTGAIPADTSVAITTQVLLAEITLNDPCFGAGAVDGTPDAVLTFDVTPIPEDASANASGTANFGRIYQSDGTTIVLQLDSVGLPASGDDIEINALAITAGAAVQLTGGTITVPEN